VAGGGIKAKMIVLIPSAPLATSHCWVSADFVFLSKFRKFKSIKVSISHKNYLKMSSKIYPLLCPIEKATIKELAEIIKKGADYSHLSKFEFEELILSRRPLELVLMAKASSKQA
jgi:hypothetical protein